MRVIALALCLSVSLAHGQSVDSVKALQSGDFAAAEQILRGEVVRHPTDAMTMSLLGAALDSQRRFAEAGKFHLRAYALAPRSVDVLNNYAAHLWMSGQEKESAGVYRQVIAVDPSQVNANLQLARVSLKERNGAEAWRVLGRLPPDRRNSPAALLLRLPAALLAANNSEAGPLADRMLEISRGDADFAYAAGVELSRAKQFTHAESFFEAALKLRPADFATLHDLGAAANLAGDHARAAEVLSAALLQQPENVDVLYALAAANEALHRNESAVALLARAARLNPSRDDVQLLLALTMTELAAFEDAVSAWDRYLKLKPLDDSARRERASVLASLGKTQEAIGGLNRFLLKHPNDVRGWYELAQAEKGVDAGSAMKHLNRALAIDPLYPPARAARGYLFYQAGKPDLAIADLEKVAELKPADSDTLDRLGQAYQALDRTSDSLRVLRRAAELSPSDSKILLHLGRALTDSGNTSEASGIMERFRQLGPEKKVGVPAGFANYLSMNEEQRRADYRMRVAKAVQDHPAEASVRLDQLRLQLEDAEFAQAAETAKIIVDLKPAPSVLAAAGHALVVAHQYGPAVEPLRLAVAAGTTIDVDIDLAIAQGSVAGVVSTVKSPAMRPELFVQATGWLISSGHVPEALQTINRAAEVIADNRLILLLKATTLEAAGKTAQADLAFRAITGRWPEWYAGWAVQGIVFEMRGQFEEAVKSLRLATLLNSNDAGTRFFFPFAEAHRSAPANSPLLRRLFEGTLYQ